MHIEWVGIVQHKGRVEKWLGNKTLSPDGDGKRKGGTQRLPRLLAATPPVHAHELQDVCN